MAETLAELLVKIKADATELEKGLTDAERKTEVSSKKMADSLKKVGVAMTASGAAITAALGMMTKAAIDEDINIKRLAISLKNVGVNYDDVKDSLEGVISATQRKTGIADNEQRDALNELITVTGDYDTALTWLQASLDMAAAKQMDTTSAARLLGRAAIGSTEMLTRYGIIIKKDATAAEILTEVQNKFSGAAEATANPLKVLSATIGDVVETLGTNLIPLVKNVTSRIVDIAIKMQEWIKEHPVLARVLTITALGLGAVLTILGGLILIIPVITSHVAAFGIVLHAALGPIGWISLAITGLITVIGLAIANWDKITNLFKSNAEKQKRALEDLTEKVKGEFDKQANAIHTSYNKQRNEAQKTYDDAITAINKEYGVAETTQKNKIELAKEATIALKEQYRKEQDAAKDRYDFEMQQIEDLYNERLSLLNAETDAQVKSLQERIDAIDTQTEEEELALQRKEEAEKLATLTGKEYAEFAAEIARRELLRTRNEEKKALRERIEEAREQAESRREQIQAEEDAALASLKTKFETEIANYKNLAEAADIDLEDALKRIEADRVAAISAENEKLQTTLTNLDIAEKADIEFFTNQLKATNQQIADINTAYNALTKRYDIVIVTHNVKESSGVSVSGIPFREPVENIPVEGFASGGIVPGAIGQPQLAMVHGGETIIPSNESMGNIVLNFTQPVFFDREDDMNRFVDKISKTLDRRYRLSGRSLT